MAGTELAKAYVQIIPSANGIKGKISGVLNDEASSAGDEAGKKAGNSLGSTIKKIIAAAGIGTALKKAISEGANLEQSLGGIETLFKNSSDKVIANARKAYKTAGLSANSYMESVTSFSASLLQGLAGDTNKAADIADMAMVDMSDNANKMGTDMQSIQNAYQGFAKQNYTMLDNLKLGYGGTKKEMERLLADAEKFSGVKYDINNLSDVYEAIHVIQGELEITGTTAEEAATTLSGSFNSVKAAFSNVLGSLALGEDIYPALEGLRDSVRTFVTGNLIPMLANIIKGLPKTLHGVFMEALHLIDFIGENADEFIQMGAELVTELVTGIIRDIPYLIKTAIDLATSIGEAIVNADWESVANDFLDNLAEAIYLIAGEVLGVDIEEAINSVMDKINVISDWVSEHTDLIIVLATAIGTLTTAIVAYNIAQAIKNAGGIIEIAQLAATAIGVGALTAAETAHSVASTIAAVATTAFGAAVSFLASPITLIIIAIGALIAVIILCVKHWDEIKAKVLEIVDKIKNKITEMKDAVVNKFQEIKTKISEKIEAVKSVVVEKFNAIKEKIITPFQAVKDKLVEIWDGIKNVISFAFQLIVNIISAYFQIITLPFRFIWENCKEYVFAVFDAIKVFITNMLDKIHTVINTTLNAIKTVWNTVWNAIVNFIMPIINGIKDFILNTFDTIKNTINTIINGIKTVIANVFNSIKDTIETILNAIKTVWNNVWDTIKNFIMPIINSIKDFISNVFSTIKNTIENIINGVKTVITNVFNSIKDAIISPLNSAKSSVNNIFDSIKNKIDGTITKAKEIVQKGIEAIKGFFDKLKLKFPDLKLPHFKIDGEFSLNPPKVPKFGIDWYAKAMNKPMIMTSPTAFGINSLGQVMAGGEKGSEVVSGTDTLMNMIASAVASQNGRIDDKFETLLSLLYQYLPQLLKMQIVLDSGKLVGETASAYNEELGNMRVQTARGW